MDSEAQTAPWGREGSRHATAPGPCAEIPDNLIKHNKLIVYLCGYKFFWEGTVNKTIK